MFLLPHVTRYAKTLRVLDIVYNISQWLFFTNAISPLIIYIFLNNILKRILFAIDEK